MSHCLDFQNPLKQSPISGRDLSILWVTEASNLKAILTSSLSSIPLFRLLTKRCPVVFLLGPWVHSVSLSQSLSTFLTTPDSGQAFPTWSFSSSTAPSSHAPVLQHALRLNAPPHHPCHLPPWLSSLRLLLLLFRPYDVKARVPEAASNPVSIICS